MRHNDNHAHQSDHTKERKLKGQEDKGEGECDVEEGHAVDGSFQTVLHPAKLCLLIVVHDLSGIHEVMHAVHAHAVLIQGRHGCDMVLVGFKHKLDFFYKLLSHHML